MAVQLRVVASLVERVRKRPLRSGSSRVARENVTTRTRILLLALLGGTALVLAIAAASAFVTSDVGPTPQFIRRVVTAFPGVPFVTCEVGQFEDATEPQRWYIRAASAGDLRIDLHALVASPSEGGGVSARLSDPRGTLLAEASVPYLASSTNTVPLRAPVSASTIYRLEVRLVGPTGGGGQAHHYRLGFSGTSVEVGVASPALPRWLEGRNFGLQVFHVNLDAGERLRLTLTAGEGQPIPSLTVELRDETGALLSTTRSTTWDPFDVVLEPGGARTLRVVTSGNHHFSLDKRSGSDRGIYFDACPPNEPR